MSHSEYATETYLSTSTSTSTSTMAQAMFDVRTATRPSRAANNANPNETSDALTVFMRLCNLVHVHTSLGEQLTSPKPQRRRHTHEHDRGETLLAATGAHVPAPPQPIYRHQHRHTQPQHGVQALLDHAQRPLPTIQTHEQYSPRRSMEAQGLGARRREQAVRKDGEECESKGKEASVTDFNLLCSKVLGMKQQAH